MTRNEWSALFQVFLEMHGALERYHTEGVGFITDAGGERCWISSAFCWRSTVEGHTYWRVLSNKWCEVVRDVMRKA